MPPRHPVLFHAPARRACIVTGLLGSLLALLGCDAQRSQSLQVGISTEAEVRAAFGRPDAEYVEPDGSRLLSYPRQPQGRTNLMVVLSPSGQYRETRQVLQPAYFQRIETGLTEEQVLRTLGRPAQRQFYALKQQGAWEWHWQDGQALKTFEVRFDAQGRVIGTAQYDDVRGLQG